MKEMTNKKKTMIAVVTALVIAVIILILALMGCQNKDTSTPDEAPATLTTETVPQQKETENITAENTEKSTVSTNANTNDNNNPQPTTTSSTTSKVENNKPVNSNTNTDNKKPETNTSSNTNSNTSTKTWHEAEYKYVNHPAETKTEKVWVVDKEAYTYEEPVYEKQWRTICNTCFADITGNDGEHGYNHMISGDNFSYHHEQVEIQTGTKTVEVPEEGHWETKTTVIKEAWTEKVLVREAGYY